MNLVCLSICYVKHKQVVFALAYSGDGWFASTFKQENKQCQELSLVGEL